MPELTKNEELVLLAIMQLKENAYGVHIRQHTQVKSGKSINYGTLYRMLDQMVKKGLLERKEGAPMAEPGGRRKTFYTLRKAGEQALQEALRYQQAVWGDITEIILNSSKNI
ncbi:helix-turn-helix transcriptional regulator [bacterium]|nr:helix-turn-helix transcriptional regulator [bacterium]